MRAMGMAMRQPSTNSTTADVLASHTSLCICIFKEGLQISMHTCNSPRRAGKARYKSETR